MPRRDSESQRKLIGRDKKLVEDVLSSYQQEGPVGRIGTQWQKGAILGAVPSMTGIKALVKAARHGKRSRRRRQRQAKAAPVVLQLHG